MRWLRRVGVALLPGVVAAAIPSGLDVPLIVTELPAVAASANLSAETTLASALRADGLAGARLVVVTPDGASRVLTNAFESAADPDVAFDGKTVLFAGRRTAADSWRIWEIGIDGTGLRAITPDTMDARDPLHVSTLFTLDSPQPWQTLLFVARESHVSESGRTPVATLYSIKLDGTEPRRLTYNPTPSLDPFQLWDGRVVYAAERNPLEASTLASRRSLFAIHIEGADMELYGGELGRRFQQMPCATEGGLVIFIESDTPTAGGSGQLALVEQRRPHLTYHAAKTDGSHQYAYPSPLRKNEVLVAQRGANPADRWSIVRFDADTGATAAVYASKDRHAIQAVAARARPSPDGHSTVVTTADNFGTLYGLDCYTTDAARTGQLQPGEVKRVRIIEGVTSAASGAASPLSPETTRRLVGEAAVEADGSFNLFVPADTPLLLQTVDDNGLALGTCGWFWVKPKEKRGCIGCHEDPERVPENKFVLALHHDSVPLLAPVAERRMVTFMRDIAPVLARLPAGTLVDTHQQPLHLSFETADGLRAAYAALTAGPDALVEPGRARTSRLIWQLAQRNTARPWDAAAQTKFTASSSPAATLGADDLRLVSLWIDLGAAFDPPSEPTAAAATAQETAK